MADLFDNVLGGVGVVLGIELVLTITNVVTSFLLPGGATMEEWLDTKLNMGATV